jgi:hypothetical protein
LKNKQTAQGGQGADPDVESGFKELIKNADRSIPHCLNLTLEVALRDDLN